jgi:hypothetical protein
LEFLVPHEEDGEEHHEAHSNGNDESGYTTQVFMRIGTGYQFKIGKFEIVPMVDLDIWRGHHALVWGMAIGRGF